MVDRRGERSKEHGCIFFRKPEWVGEVGKDKDFCGKFGYKDKDFKFCHFKGAYEKVLTFGGLFLPSQ